MSNRRYRRARLCVAGTEREGGSWILDLGGWLFCCVGILADSHKSEGTVYQVSSVGMFLGMKVARSIDRFEQAQAIQQLPTCVSNRRVFASKSKRRTIIIRPSLQIKGIVQRFLPKRHSLTYCHRQATASVRAKRLQELDSAKHEAQISDFQHCPLHTLDNRPPFRVHGTGEQSRRLVGQVTCLPRTRRIIIFLRSARFDF
jgi:hypothetical protein